MGKFGDFQGLNTHTHPLFCNTQIPLAVDGDTACQNKSMYFKVNVLPASG